MILGLGKTHRSGRPSVAAFLGLQSPVVLSLLEPGARAGRGGAATEECLASFGN